MRSTADSPDRIGGAPGHHEETVCALPPTLLSAALHCAALPWRLPGRFNGLVSRLAAQLHREERFRCPHAIETTQSGEWISAALKTFTNFGIRGQVVR